MAIKTPLVLFSLTLFMYIHSGFMPAYAQQSNEEISADHELQNAQIMKNNPFNYEYKIRIQEEADYDCNRSTLLNPNCDFSSDKNYYTRMLFDLGSKLFLSRYFDITFHDQTAWKWQEKEKIEQSAVKNYLQEIFLTARIYDTLILDAGRENIISGVAYGWNPTDYMLGASISADPDPRALREQRVGAYLVKASLFFDFGQVTALYSPKINDLSTNKSSRQLYKISCRPFDNLMLEILFFNGKAYQNYGQKRNRLGSNIEFSLTDDLILHFEGSAAKGSDVNTVEEANSSDYNTYEFIERKDKLYAKTVLGFNYTLPDMHNVILEFYYNGEGYSGNEWDKYFSMLEYSGHRYNSDVYENPAGSGFNPYFLYMTIANSMTQISRMSRYYLFLMLSKQNILMDNFDYRFFTYFNLYDISSFLNMNIEYSFANYFKAGIISSYNAGKKKSEFGFSSKQYSILGYLSVYF